AAYHCHRPKTKRAFAFIRGFDRSSPLGGRLIVGRNAQPRFSPLGMHSVRVAAGRLGAFPESRSGDRKACPRWRLSPGSLSRSNRFSSLSLGRQSPVYPKALIQKPGDWLRLEALL